MKFKNISEITNWVFAGNYMSDCVAFSAIDQFALNIKNTLSDRAESLRILTDKGMGCGRDEQMSDSEIVQDYIDNL